MTDVVLSILLVGGTLLLGNLLFSIGVYRAGKYRQALWQYGRGLMILSTLGGLGLAIMLSLPLFIVELLALVTLTLSARYGVCPQRIKNYAAKKNPATAQQLEKTGTFWASWGDLFFGDYNTVAAD